VVRELPAAAFTPEPASCVWAWIKLTVCLWLLRKMIKAGGWLLLAALEVCVPQRINVLGAMSQSVIGRPSRLAWSGSTRSGHLLGCG
jgi:hypothetical protein